MTTPGSSSRVRRACSGINGFFGPTRQNVPRLRGERQHGMSVGGLLVVEDDRSMARLLEYLLLTNGYQVHIATTVAAARAVVAEASIDLVLLDRVLPDGDGPLQVGQRYLRSRHGRHGAPRGGPQDRRDRKSVV